MSRVGRVRTIRARPAHIPPASTETRSGPLKEYRVFIDGIEHTMLLSEDDAKRRGLETDTKAADKPANKGASAPKNKAKS